MSFWIKMLSRVLLIAAIVSLAPSLRFSRDVQAPVAEFNRVMAAVSDLVPRERVLWNAENLRSYHWLYNGIEIQGLPYGWGSFMSPTQFTESYTGAYNSTLGVDCSSFVSRAWEMSAHYGTWWLGDASISQPIADKRSLKPGDIYDDRIGTAEQQHVTLHYKYDQYNFPWVYEATESRQMPYGTPWTGGVRLYHDFDGTRSVENTEYTGHRYNKIAEDRYVYLPYVKGDSQTDTVIHVANLDTSLWRIFQVEFYNYYGASLGQSDVRSLAPGGRTEVSASSYMSGSQAWAVVRTIDQVTTGGSLSVAAELRAKPGQPAKREAYPALTVGSDRIALPQVMKDYYSWNSEFQILNISQFPVYVTLQFYNRDGSGPLTYAQPIFLASNAIKRVDLRVEPPPGMGSNWVGSVIATAKNYNTGQNYLGNLMVTVNNKQDSTNASVLYNGTNGSQARPKIYATQFYREYYDWNSGITVTNMGNRAEVVELRFTELRNGNTYFHSETIEPKRSKILFATAIPEVPTGFSGSVQAFTTQYRQPLAMNTNLSNTANGANRQFTYEGGTIGAYRLVAPVAHNDGSYVDGLVVTNVDTANANIVVDYYNDAGQWQGYRDYYGLPPLRSWSIYPTGPSGFKGTARIVSNSPRLLANLNMTAQGVPVGQDPDASYLIPIPGIDEINPTAYGPN